MTYHAYAYARARAGIFHRLSIMNIVRVRVRAREGWGLCITPESTLSPMPGFVFLLAMFGSFLLPVHNSPAALAADEIWVQKKRVVSDAPEAWFLGCSFMDFSLCFYLKTLPTSAGQGRLKLRKTSLNGTIRNVKSSLTWEIGDSVAYNIWYFRIGERLVDL